MISTSHSPGQREGVFYDALYSFLIVTHLKVTTHAILFVLFLGSNTPSHPPIQLFSPPTCFPTHLHFTLHFTYTSSVHTKMASRVSMVILRSRASALPNRLQPFSSMTQDMPAVTTTAPTTTVISAPTAPTGCTIPPQNGNEMLPQSTTHHTAQLYAFGHPSSGGPLVDPFVAPPPVLASSIFPPSPSQLAGESARAFKPLQPVAVDLYGELAYPEW